MKQSLRFQLAERGGEKTEWDRVLQRAAFAHNTLQNSSTKFTPSELMYGTKIRTFIDVAAGAEASRNDGEGCAQEELPSRGALEEK